MADNDASMQSSDEGMHDRDELDVHVRLSSICALDVRITKILQYGSALTQAIADGKLPGDVELKRENFKAAVENYNGLVEEVNGKLRREVKLLHDASHSQLLPLNIPVQASAFGREKEAMLHQSLALESRGSDSSME